MSFPPVARTWDGVGHLGRAIDYARGSLQLVTPTAMGAPTPCAGWDLRTLLDHMNDSLQALEEAAVVRRVWVDVRADPADDPVGALRERACHLLAAWSADSGADVCVDGRPVTADVLASAGALEVLVHGWDVARACGADRPLPAALARDLLTLVPLLVTDADRPSRFAAEVPLAGPASPGDRLLALLGRAP